MNPLMMPPPPSYDDAVRRPLPDSSSAIAKPQFDENTQKWITQTSKQFSLSLISEVSTYMMENPKISSEVLVKTLLDRINLNVSRNYNFEPRLQINTLETRTAGNPSDPGDWDWETWESAIYKSDQDTTIPFGMKANLQRYLDNDKLKKLVSHPEIIAINPRLVEIFNKRFFDNPNNGFIEILSSYETITDFKPTVFIKAMIEYQLLDENIINKIHLQRKKTGVRS